MRSILSAGALGVGAILLAVLLAVAGSSGSGSTLASGGPAPSAVADIPADYLALYAAAGQARGIDWAVLAAIGKTESDHGRSTAQGVRSGLNFHGCCAGPMQFFVNRALTGGGPTTWDRYGVDGDGDGRADPYDAADAIPAAADYLAAAGAPRDYRRAIFAYNHSSAYVAQVLDLADRYRAAAIAVPQETVVGAPMAVGRLAAVPVEYATRAGIFLDDGVLPTALAIADGFQLRILSGYRSPEHNRSVGGRPHSDHLCGLGVDFVGSMPAMLAMQAWAMVQGFAFVDGPATNTDGNHDDHVHVSFARCR